MIRQVVRFGLIGVVSTLVHLTAALFLHHLFGFSPLWSNAMAFMTAWLVSYVGNWVWTFEAATTHRHSAPRFLIVALGGFALNQLIVLITNELWGWPFWLALVPVVMIVPLVGFIASRYWAYRQSEAS
jgi:putative flippase GtrA